MRAPQDGTPVPVLAEGTAPAAIRYQPARRRRWPFVAAGLAIAAAAAITYVASAKRDARRDLETRYPIAASATQQAQLADGAARWTKGRTRLLATLAAFDAPELSTLKGVGACQLDTARSDDERARSSLVTDGEAPAWDDRDLDVTLRHVILPDESLGDLAALARPEIDQLIAAAERGRFQTAAGRDHVLHALDGAFVLVRVTELHQPELDRAHDGVVPGVLAGTAYAFDPTSGALRCAGSFRATSSANAGSPSHYAGLDRANEAVIHDFEAQVESAIVASLRAVD